MIEMLANIQDFVLTYPIPILILMLVWFYFAPKIIAPFLQDKWFLLPEWLKGILRTFMPRILDALVEIWNEIDIITEKAAKRTRSTVDDQLQDLVDKTARQQIDDLKTTIENMNRR